VEYESAFSTCVPVLFRQMLLSPSRGISSPCSFVVLLFIGLLCAVGKLLLWRVLTFSSNAIDA
jgi:hypothetical protein